MKSTWIALACAGFATTAALAEPATYTVEPTHTFVTFEALHQGTSTNRGRFDKKEGTIVFDKAAKTGKVDITLETGSINTGTGPFDGHLKKEFFKTEQFPTARFVGDKFTFSGDKVASVEGQLTLVGQTHPVTLKASAFNCYENTRIKREVCGGDFETTIARSQWGITSGLPGIPDNIKLLIQIEAIKQ